MYISIYYYLQFMSIYIYYNLVSVIKAYMLHKDLKLKQISESLEKIKKMKIPGSPREGWLKSIRTALWMNMDRAASKAGINTSTWEKIEKREQKGTATMETIRKAADALNCDVHLILIPREPLGKIIEKQAFIKADEEIQRLDETMSLEQQKNSPTFLKDMRNKLAQNYMNNPKDLWQ